MQSERSRKAILVLLVGSRFGFLLLTFLFSSESTSTFISSLPLKGERRVRTRSLRLLLHRRSYGCRIHHCVHGERLLFAGVDCLALAPWKKRKPKSVGGNP